MNQIIKETKNYTLTVGQSKPNDTTAYLVINKEHGVVEIETFILPQALKFLDELQVALDVQIDPSIS